jgi:hypothetical protein
MTMTTARVGTATISPIGPRSLPMTSTATIDSTGGRSTFFDITSGKTTLLSTR